MVYRSLKLHYCPAKTAGGTVVDASNSPHHQARHVADYPFVGSSIFYCLCWLYYKRKIIKFFSELWGELRITLILVLFACVFVTQISFPGVAAVGLAFPHILYSLGAFETEGTQCEYITMATTPTKQTFQFPGNQCVA